MDEAFAAPIEYDAAADWYIESYEKYLAAYADPYYINVIEPDENNFVNKGQLDGTIRGTKTVVRAITTLGVYRSMIQDGKASVEVKDEIWTNFKEYHVKEARIG
jgi:hypothetical protein